MDKNKSRKASDALRIIGRSKWQIPIFALPMRKNPQKRNYGCNWWKHDEQLV